MKEVPWAEPVVDDLVVVVAVAEVAAVVGGSCGSCGGSASRGLVDLE